MVAVNYQNRALWQQANDFKTRFIKKKKITITVPLGLLYVLFGMFICKLWLIWIQPSPLLYALASNACLNMRCF